MTVIISIYAISIPVYITKKYEYVNVEYSAKGVVFSYAKKQ